MVCMEAVRVLSMFVMNDFLLAAAAVRRYIVYAVYLPFLLLSWRHFLSILVEVPCGENNGDVVIWCK